LEYKADIEDIFKTYHDLTSNYNVLPVSSTYLENIFSINQKIGQKLEIDEPLYMILKQAEEIKTLTNGYFDISIGKAIDLWKSIIENDYDDNIVSDEDFELVTTAIEALDFSSNQVILSEEEGHYYIETKGDNVKLDLGAISKGYATQRAVEYLEDNNVTYYFINSGSSSLFMGKNSNLERDYFNIGLTCPICSAKGSYGTIKNVMNQSVTTSGDYEQYVLHDDLRYHHIISPVTKMPMQYYHTVTLVGDDAGLLDALSTALFSMPEDVFASWMLEHQVSLNLSYVRFNIDETISQSLLDDLIFEAIE
ncbi:MAG: FAD:protein FMN transferase, partial [Acholeplasmataceae bacterium]